MLDRNPANRISGPAPAEPAPPVRRGVKSTLMRFTARLRLGLMRRLSSSLTRRIAFLNFAGLLALFLGFLWLNQTRVGVIDARSQSLSLQAEIISAAIASATSVGDNTIQLDPDKLLQQQLSETPQREEQAPDWFEFSINPARVAPILKRLVTPTRTRARVFDLDGLLLLDTKAFYMPGSFADPRPKPDDDSDWTLFTRTWNAVKQRFGRIELSQPDSPTSQGLPEVLRAVKGVPSNVVRVATDGQTIVYAASPIQRGNRVKGALLLSTQEGDVDRIIAEERWGFVLVFLIATGVMLVLSVLLAGTIAEPVRRLSEAADRVRRGTRAREEIPDFSERSDEIGQLSASLRDMTGALYSRIEAIERFAADVAHELKNPLTSLRSAVETLPLARNPDSRDRLLSVIVHDVKRLDRLITDISDASRLDAELQRAQAEVFDLGALLGTVAGMKNDVLKPGEARVELALPPVAGPRQRPLLVRGHDSRLVQVFNNLIDNAQSFSPPDSAVHVRAVVTGPRVEIRVEDSGPGIPDHALERIFERFYTDRPDHGFGQNSGLGLAISKQIVEAHGGTIRAENILDAAGERAGARLIVTLPLAGPVA